MTSDDYDETDWLETQSSTCPRCEGVGTIVVCVDDMCRNGGDGCAHKGGVATCPDCDGICEVFDATR